MTGLAERRTVLIGALLSVVLGVALVQSSLLLLISAATMDPPASLDAVARMGHWPRSPFGPVTDVMVERADGHRHWPGTRRWPGSSPTRTRSTTSASWRPATGVRRSGPDWAVAAGPPRSANEGFDYAVLHAISQNYVQNCVQA